jgi:hypothetical protein
VRPRRRAGNHSSEQGNDGSEQGNQYSEQGNQYSEQGTNVKKRVTMERKRATTRDCPYGLLAARVRMTDPSLPVCSSKNNRVDVGAAGSGMMEKTGGEPADRWQL